jgi:hypothetical protein
VPPRAVRYTVAITPRQIHPMRTSRTNESSGYDLPRPALGRRPWLAFCLRARRRRRFAFAMVRESNSVAAGRHSTQLRTASGWSSGPCVVALDRSSRRIGSVPHPGPWGFILRTHSIHSFGMRAPLHWCALDRAGRVLRVGALAPRRLVVIPRACLVVEYPPGNDRPAVGERVWVDRLPSWSAP